MFKEVVLGVGALELALQLALDARRRVDGVMPPAMVSAHPAAQSSAPMVPSVASVWSGALWAWSWIDRALGSMPMASRCERTQPG